MSFLDRFKRPGQDGSEPKKPPGSSPLAAPLVAVDPVAPKAEPLRPGQTSRIAAAVNTGATPGFKGLAKKARETLTKRISVPAAAGGISLLRNVKKLCKTSPKICQATSARSSRPTSNV